MDDRLLINSKMDMFIYKLIFIMENKVKKTNFIQLWAKKLLYYCGVLKIN